MDHIYNEEDISKSNKTKKNINKIKKRVEEKYISCTRNMTDAEKRNAAKTLEYIYKLINDIIDSDNISFNIDVISKLTFNNFINDIKLINEGVNGNDKLQIGNIYIPRLDNKSFYRKFAYPLVDLVFNNDSIEVNEITEQKKIDGDSRINYDSFISKYISLDTYLMNATYINKGFKENESHKEDSQDFSNSKLLFNYHGILLIETVGEYEIVSHETITMAGYDIPEPLETKRVDSFMIETYKKLISLKISFLAESFREDETTLSIKNN